MVITTIPAPTRSYFFSFTTKAKLTKATEHLSGAVDILYAGQTLIDPEQLRVLSATCDMLVLPRVVPLVQSNV
jgi:hypothetical protein